jgi:thymidylate kinase
MFIIVEGPDGAGKSTFVKELVMELWRRGRGTVLINPKRSPNQPALMEYKVRLDFYKPRTGLDLILDRCWYSDDVYGPLWRGEGLDPKVREELEEWAQKKGAAVAYLDQPNEVLLERVLGDRFKSDDPSDTQHMTKELVCTYADEYRRQMPSWDLETVLNPAVDQIIRLASSTEDRAKGR